MVHDFPETRHSLLVRVQRDDSDAWSEFAKIYRPVIYRLVRRRGWQDADAQDVAQQVLIKVSAALTRFQPDHTRARFRTWLTTVCHNTLIDELRRRKPDAPAGDPAAALGRVADPLESEVTEDELSIEHRRQVFRWAAARTKHAFEDSTWHAFWLTAVDGIDVKQTAHQLGMSIGAVYTARSRVMQFMKQQVREFDDADM